MTRCESYPPCFGTIYFPTAPLFYHSKIQRLCRCRASHSLILSLSHQVKTNTRFARACFPADVPNYAIFSCLHLILHQMM